MAKGKYKILKKKKENQNRYTIKNSMIDRIVKQWTNELKLLKSNSKYLSFLKLLY